MIRVTDIIADTNKTLGTQLWLTGVRPYYQYNGGVRTGVIDGYKYTVAAMDRGLRKIDVKIPGEQIMETPEKHVPVRVSGIEIKIYRQRDGDYGVTATATGIAPIHGQPQESAQANK